jgi:hypothetical protein
LDSAIDQHYLFALDKLDRSGKGNREGGNQMRREITLPLRRFLITISHLGYADFSESFVGHSISTYWTKKDSEKAEIFRRIESYLTFISRLERQGADIQSSVDLLF